MPESTSQRILIGVATVIAAAAVAVGGYALGSSGGEDLDSARSEGAAAGLDDGQREGRVLGYETGFRVSKKGAFIESRPKGYRKAYRDLLEESGIDPDSGGQSHKSGG